MYEVTIINDGVKTIVHSPSVNELKLPSGVIKKGINLIDSFNFSFYMNNPGFHKIKPLKTLINVLNTKTGKYEFEGRVLGPSKNMDNSGLHSDSYECEGELGYLHDSVQQHLEFRGTPKELFTKILDYHNKQVEEYKSFKVGNVTVTNSTNNLYLYLSAEKDTFETIKEKLIDKLGGELQIRKVNGVRFLDYLERVGEDKKTEIRIAKNLISMSCDIDPTEIITRLTPLGARIESKNEGATDASEARLTIESVNAGKPYIDAPEGIKEFGIQGGSITWDDVTLVENLISKGKEWLKQQKTILTQYKISAVDLYLIGLDIDYFEVGNSHPVINPVMGINELLRIVGKSIDINSPQGASLTIGDELKTLNQYQSDSKKSSQKVIDLQYTVSRQVAKISSLSTSLSEAKQELQGLKEGIENADLQGIIKLVSGLEDSLQQIEEEIQNLPTTAVIEQIRSEVQGNAESIVTVNKNIETVVNEIKMISGNFKTLQSDVQALDKRVTALEGTGDA
ncbi:lysin [Bacillus thuringiensis serovar brasilensis]|uniref:phage tail protein n=1 Tax=Bacillus cereus group TaxID=86661 RepID=UPI000A3BD80A|nr:phage tail protein [Bacillus thuringiensis]MCU5028584.1 phage tail protein [Bacillus cereus]MRA71920.1 lysin [Bacillus thuringiensis]MRA91196.1 lysin [Bacillus thuringiensis]MRC53413.1 lysin [Bacillus thuringiensis]OTX29669.1 lysin [Bacillus thuringiensis serovar brasilensis]